MSRYAWLAIWCLISTVTFAESYRFDMGGPTTPVAAGYTQVTLKDVWAEGREFGWLTAPGMLVNRNEPTNPWLAQPESLEYRLLSDALLTVGENTFIFKVAPGRYAVTAFIGDLALGEGRPGNSIWANGAQVVKDAETNATVKAFTFPVEAPEGKIELRFRADSSQRYATVQGVSAEPLAAGAALELTVKQYPEAPPTKETYLRNWDALQDQILADWAQAKLELTAEGVALAYWQGAVPALKRQPGYREFWGWSLGGGTWERLSAQTGGLDASRLMAGFKEMGIEGFQTNNATLSAELTRAGLKHAVSASAELFPTGDLTGITLNLLKNADGSTKTIDKVWSNVAPEVIATFQEAWRQRLPAAAPGASFFLIDEPRGMWGSGCFGDYSPPAQEAFKRWCAEQGYADLAASGIPERGRTLGFYRFYQFRLQSVALLVKAFTKDTPVEKVPIAPGNGNVGPEQMNHSNYWPPAMAKRGLISTGWAYDDPPSCKMYAETVAMAREFGGQSIIVPPLYPELQTPLQAAPMHTACVSAMTDRVSPWHFGGPLNGPNRPEWMKAVYYSARLTHAMSGLAHTPPLHVWCPESIVFNDLANMDRKEAEHWRATWQALSEANVDYAVTNTLALPKGAVALYSCAKPVLSDEEFAQLQAFVARGGRVLCTFTDAPERPDGSVIAQWAKLPRAQVAPLALEPAALAQAAGAERNLAAETLAVKTYLYRRGGQRVHLLNNTSLTEPASVRLPRAGRDVLTDRALAQGSRVALRPGGHALVEER